MSKIFHITEQNELVALRPADYDAEDVLQALLESYPDLLDGEQIEPKVPRQWMLVSRECRVPGEIGGSGRWSLDHLFLDQDGIPTLVEVKLCSDTRIRREVVGQMLDYAANGVKHWASIQATFADTCRTDGVDADEKTQKLIGPEGDITAFWARVDENLRAGRIRMLFVADEIPDELLRIIEFLNVQMDPAEVLGIAIKKFSSGSVQTMVPRVMGRTIEAEDRKKTGGGRSTRKWDEASFLEQARKLRSEAEVTVAISLLRWAEKHATRIWWGEGAIKANFIPILEVNGQKHYLFDCFVRETRASAATQFGYWKEKPPFSDDARRRELLAKFNAIPGVNLPDTADNFPPVTLQSLTNPAALRQFLEVMEWFIQQVTQSR